MERDATAKRKSLESGKTVEDKVREENTMVELEGKIWSHVAQSKRRKEDSNKKENGQSQSLNEDERRKIMDTALDNILKNMLTLVDVCNFEGFVYGLIPKKGEAINAVSENLRHWWKEKVDFDRNARLAIMRYNAGKPDEANKEELNINGNHYASLRSLRDFPETTLRILLTCLLHHCNPPQTRFPVEGGLPPPWWPKGDEEWWPLLGFNEDQGPPPYMKHQNLKKAGKVAVIAGIIKHLSPDIQKIRNIVCEQKKLQDKMSTKETASLAAILNHEEFLSNHERLSDLLHDTTDYAGIGGNNIESGINSIMERHYNHYQNANLVQHEANVQGSKNVITPIAMKKTMQTSIEIYTCDSLHCPYNNYQNGFRNKGIRDYHYENCPYRNKSVQIAQPEKVLEKTAIDGKDSSSIKCNTDNFQNTNVASSCTIPLENPNEESNLMAFSGMFPLMGLKQQPQTLVNMNQQQQQNPQLHMEVDFFGNPARNSSTQLNEHASPNEFQQNTKPFVSQLDGAEPNQAIFKTSTMDPVTSRNHFTIE